MGVYASTEDGETKYPHIKNEQAKKSPTLGEEQEEKSSKFHVINTSKIGILQYFYFLSVFIQSIFI